MNSTNQTQKSDLIAATGNSPGKGIERKMKLLKEVPAGLLRALGIALPDDLARAPD
jgi:hypothetical protein